jgi:DNA polymerase-3 subunit beta
MKFLILKDNLKKGLSVVEKIVSKNITLPILNNILIKTEKTFLCLISTNLEIGIKYWVLSKINEEGSLVVPSKLFSGFISAINTEKVNIESKGNSIDVKSEDLKTQIKGFDPQEFPLIPEIDNQETINVDAKDFCAGLTQVINYCSINQSRPEISGVYLSFQKEKVTFVATDSFRLAEKSIFIKEGFKKDHSFIIPQKTAQEIVNIFSEEESIKIYFNTNQILLESSYTEVNHPKVQLTSTLIQGDFPNYKEIIPKKYETKIIINPDELANKVRIASLFSNKTNEIRLDVDCEKGINIYSQNTDIGENESHILAQVEGTNQSICFNYKYLLDGILSTQSKTIIFEVNGDSGPSVIKSSNDPNFLYLVMPIKNS